MLPSELWHIMRQGLPLGSEYFPSAIFLMEQINKHLDGTHFKLLSLSVDHGRTFPYCRAARDNDINGAFDDVRHLLSNWDEELSGATQ